MKRLFLTFSLFIITFTVCAKAVIVDVRHRPPEMVIKNNELSGPVKKLIETLFQTSGIQLDWRIVPWARTLTRAMKGEVDIVPRHSLNEERELFLEPMLIGFEDRHVMYLLSSRIEQPQRFDSLEKFDGLRFGLLRGSYYSPQIEKIKFDKNILYANSIEQLMALLLKNRIDVLPMQNIVWAEKAFESVAQNHPNQGYQIAAYQDHFLSGKFISISKKSRLAKYYHQLNCAMFKLRKQGKVDEIYHSFNVPAYAQSFEHELSKQQQTSCVSSLAGVSRGLLFDSVSLD